MTFFYIQKKNFWPLLFVHTWFSSDIAAYYSDAGLNMFNSGPVLEEGECTKKLTEGHIYVI